MKNAIKNIGELFEKYNVAEADQKAYGRIATAAILWSMIAGAYVCYNVYGAYLAYKETRDEIRADREAKIMREAEIKRQQSVAAMRNKVERE